MLIEIILLENSLKCFNINKIINIKNCILIEFTNYKLCVCVCVWGGGGGGGAAGGCFNTACVDLKVHVSTHKIILACMRRPMST